MELYDTRDVLKLAELSGPMPTEIVRYFIHQVLDGLDVLHS